ncbi:MAG: cell division control protein Cdc6, partial [Candidatus Thermoplasmatota archaeon]|nr:cell division control protein Cdc6 [Candidatus Thermoplasmatota archaeon]
KEIGRETLTTGEMYDTYKTLSMKANTGILTQRRITDLISELDMLGIINARVISYGRGGRTREISASVSVKDTKKVLEEDELLKGVSNYKPLRQVTLV